MNNEPIDPEEAPLDVEDLRHHSYDGIQEYDKRLPNWWLFTLYGAIVFSFAYWSYAHHWHMMKDPGQAVTDQIQANSLEAAKNSGVVTDEDMWALSKDQTTIAAGQTTFSTTCFTCHGEHLEGKIGPTLIKTKWLHGGRPTEIIHTITTGVAAKGMPTWGPVLGQDKIKEVAAFILSKQTSRGDAAPAAGAN